ncbi:MAG: hypothetical protein IT456_04955 [Planctomycetes bacterium]|nr:hypothetical protein [Planctomycetota bacterium]
MNAYRLLLPLLLLAPIAAQRTVIVDAANGPGTNHTTLASAFAALQADDVLVVRAGVYAGLAFSTALPFVMMGEGNPIVQPGTAWQAALQITTYGSQYQRIAIKGMRFESQTTGQWALTVRSGYNTWPAPTVHLEDCEVLSMSPQSDRVGLLAEGVGLTAHRCNLNTTQVIGSLASFVDCTIWGCDQVVYQFGNQRAMTAIDVLRSEVWFVNTTLTAGSSNGAYGEPAACVGFSDGSFTAGSRVYASGNCSFAADPAPNALWPVPSVFHNYLYYYAAWPTVEYEPGVVFVPSPLGPTFSQSITQVTRTIPHLRATAAPLGGVATFTVHGATGDFVALLLGFSTYAQRMLGHALLVDSAVASTAGFAVLPAGQEVAFPFAVPNDAAMRGLGFEASAALLSTLGGIDATNPAAAIVQ